MNDIKEFRFEVEKDLEEKLYVVLESWYSTPELYVLLAGHLGFYVHHYMYRADIDSWEVCIEDFSNMKSALEFISKVFKDDYEGNMLKFKENTNE